MRVRAAAPGNPLALALQALPATGPSGFEGLVAGLLSDLTDVPFRPARSGEQGGRDLDSDHAAPWAAVVECKRYRDQTPLGRRELVSEIQIALRDDPQIDLWVLATSRDVDANVTRWLQEEARERGIDYLVLASGSTTEPDDLDALCANGAPRVLRHCARVLTTGTSDLESYLVTVSGSMSIASRLQRIRSAFNAGTVGLASFRDGLNEKLVRALSDEMRSLGRFGRRLDVAGDGHVRDISRSAVRTRLEAFLNAPVGTEGSALCVVHGEEGNGKTWAVASWIHERMSQVDAPAVFWFSAGDCSTAQPMQQLADHANQNLAGGREINFYAKLQRWVAGATRRQLLVVLDGINERHQPDFWAGHLFRSLGEFDGHVSIILTCRTQTWADELAERLPLQPQLVEVGSFDDNEFAAAMMDLDAADVDRLRRVGPLVRKPRYLATAIQVLHELQLGEDLTVERLYYEVVRRQVRTRTTYPLSGRDLEEVLRHLAQQESDWLSTRDATVGLPVADPSGDIFRELASGGVLRASRDTGYVVEQRYLVAGVSLLLVDTLRANVGTIEEHRERVARLLSDTHRLPLTAQICAAASFRALVDASMTPQAATAIVLEFIHCQNPDPNALEGVLLEAAKHVEVLCDVCERLWAEQGVDHAVERMVLKGLVRSADDPARRGVLKVRLARWAGFVHLSGEHERDASEPNAAAARERVVQIVPSVGQVSSIGGDVSLTRVADQRLLRLGRLALAVVSFSDRRFFYPLLVTCLVADAAMTSSRTEVVHWVLASSRQPLADLVRASLGTLTGLSTRESDRVERILVRAVATSELATALRVLDARAPRSLLDEGEQRAFRNPTRTELPEYLIDPEVPPHFRLSRAKAIAPDPSAVYPPQFVADLRGAVASFNSRARRSSLHTNDADYSWESFEPILCRVDPPLLLAKLLDFVNDVSNRTGEALRAWAFEADGLTQLLSDSGMAMVRQAWRAVCERPTDLSDNERLLEATLFSMLLPHVSATEQVDMLIGRHRNAHLLARAGHRFSGVISIEEQRAIAARIGSSSNALTAVLWFASEQVRLDDGVWLAPVLRGLASTSTVDRGLALHVALRLSPQAQEEQVVPRIDVRPAEANALEKLFGTQLLLRYAKGPALGVLARCDLGDCCHFIGGLQSPRREEMLKAFAGLVLDWIRRLIRPPAESPTALPIVVQDPRTSAYPWAGVGVDWSERDRTVSFRSEMGVWGGLPPGEAGELARALEGDEGQAEELQSALRSALDAAQQTGDWGFASFWSDDTLIGLVEAEASFLPEVESLLREATVRQTLHPVLPFATALCRSLLPGRSADALRLMSVIHGQRVLTTDIDGWSGENLFDLALFAAPESEATGAEWLRRLDASTNDAQLLQCCEQLRAGGNSAWLHDTALRDLRGGAPFYQRRGILLLAVAAVDDQAFETGIESSSWEASGLDELVDWARQYRASAQWMVHWIGEGIGAECALDAYCSARLLLLCADRRVWRLLSAARSEGATPGNASAFFDILSRDDIKNALNRNESDGRKTLLGVRLCKHDAAPWIEL